jgi:hypothetical protein
MATRCGSRLNGDRLVSADSSRRSVAEGVPRERGRHAERGALAKERLRESASERPRGAHVLPTRVVLVPADLVPDLHVAALLDVQPSDDDRDQRDRDRIDQPGIDVAGRGQQPTRDQGEEPTEPAVPDVIWNRKGGVPDPRRELYDQERRDRAVDHRHEDDLNPDERDQRQDLGLSDGRCTVDGELA